MTKNVKKNVLTEQKLNSFRRTRARIRLAEAVANHRAGLIVEEIDANDLNELATSLANIKKITSTYNLPKLNAGIDAAMSSARQLMGSMGGGLLGAAGAAVSKMFGGVGRIVAFEASLIKALKQLPQLVQLVNSSQKNIASDEEKSTKPLGQVLNQKLRNQFANMFMTALRPPGLLGWVRGSAFIRDNEVAREITNNLSYKQLTEISQDTGALAVPLSPEEVKEISAKAQKTEPATKQGEEKPVTPEQSPSSQKPLTPPGQDQLRINRAIKTNRDDFRQRMSDVVDDYVKNPGRYEKLTVKELLKQFINA